MEPSHVASNLLRVIAERINADHHNLGAVLKLTAVQIIIEAGQLMHGQRTDIRAVGKAEKHHGPLTIQRILSKRTAVVIQQLEVVDNDWLLVEDSANLAQLLR